MWVTACPSSSVMADNVICLFMLLFYHLYGCYAAFSLRGITIDFDNLQFGNDFTEIGNAVSFVVTLKCHGKQTHDAIMQIIASMDDLAYFEEL